MATSNPAAKSVGPKKLVFKTALKNERKND